MYRIITLFAIVFSLVTCKVTAQEKKQKINYEKEGYVKARIIHYNVENCGYLIELTDKAKTKIAPDKLAAEFKKDKEKIWVKYTMAKKQPMSTCMAGKLAEIIDVKKRK
jgi:uncharacterized lipoprotein NlpE involved in copper resistance